MKVLFSQATFYVSMFRLGTYSKLCNIPSDLVHWPDPVLVPESTAVVHVEPFDVLASDPVPTVHAPNQDHSPNVERFRLVKEGFPICEIQDPGVQIQLQTADLCVCVSFLSPPFGKGKPKENPQPLWGGELKKDKLPKSRNLVLAICPERTAEEHRAFSFIQLNVFNTPELKKPWYEPLDYPGMSPWITQIEPLDYPNRAPQTRFMVAVGKHFTFLPIVV